MKSTKSIAGHLSIPLDQIRANSRVIVNGGTVITDKVLLAVNAKLSDNGNTVFPIVYLAHSLEDGVSWKRYVEFDMAGFGVELLNARTLTYADLLHIETVAGGKIPSFMAGVRSQVLWEFCKRISFVIAACGVWCQMRMQDGLYVESGMLYWQDDEDFAHFFTLRPGK